MAVKETELNEIMEVVTKLRKEVDKISEAKGDKNKTTEKLENLQNAVDKYEETMGQVKSLKDQYENFKQMKEENEELNEKVTLLENWKKDATDTFGFEEKKEEKKVDKEKEAKFNAFMNYAKKGIRNVGPDSTKQLDSLSDGAGGYIVPDDYREQLLMKLDDLSVMRGLVSVINTSKDRIRVPGLDGSFNWSFGDGTSMPTANTESPYEMTSIDIKYASALIKMSAELLEDSVFNVADHIADRFGNSRALKEDDMIIGGNGHDEPEGILTNADILANRVTTTGTSASMDADDFLDTMYEVDQKYARNGSLLVRRKIVKELRKLKDGNGQYLWEPSLKTGEPATFDGAPIYQPSSSELDNTVSSDNFVAIFGDFRYYWLVDRIGMTMQRLDEKYAPLIGLFFKVRFGGKVVIPEAFEVLQVQ